MVRYDDTAFRKMRGEWVQLANLTLMIGVVGPGASALEAGSSLTLAELALVHEYGATIKHPSGAIIEIPERSFIRSTLMARRGDLAALQARVFKRILAGELTATAGLELIGEQCIAWIRQTIRDGLDPPLATETILAKKSTKPLIDHGQLINAIAYQVVAKGAAGAVATPPEAVAA
jgi:hypothetical protein